MAMKMGDFGDNVAIHLDCQLCSSSFVGVEETQKKILIVTSMSPQWYLIYDNLTENNYQASPSHRL